METEAPGTLRRVGLAAAACAAGLVPWTAYLAASLPTAHRAPHWNVSWAGFDVLLVAAFAATGWAGLRRPRLLPACLLATAVLLLCDAWFDVSTAVGTADQGSALLELGLELPVAATALALARRLATRAGSRRPRPSRARPASPSSGASA